MSNPIQIRWPVGGVSEDFGFSDQPGLTARDASNVRGIDPVTGRLRGAVRSGTSRYVNYPANAIIPAIKVAHINSIVTANTNQVIGNADPNDANLLVQEWHEPNTVKGDTLGVQCGTQGDVYSLDGNCGVMKRNRDGALMWKLTLAATDKNHVCRALLVDSGTPKDAGTDLVLVGVSYGGDSTTAKAWAYIQLNDNKVQKLWELIPGGYTEAFAISKDKLFLGVNFPDQNRSYIIVYDDYLTNTPTEVNRWTVPYPLNDMTASTFDGFIFSAHESSSDRDTMPSSPKSTWASEDWTINDLTSSKYRVWADLDASKIDTIAISPRNLAYPTQAGTVATAPPPNLFDGGNVTMWVDSSEQGRNLYQTADRLPIVNPGGTGFVNGQPASRGAIYKATGGPNGMPCLHFDGRTTGMVSEAPSSKDKANRTENLSLLPSYKGAQFACFMVVRASADNVRRGLLCWGGDASSDTTTVSRTLLVNSNAGQGFSSAIGAADMAGQVSIYENGGIANDASTANTACGAPSSPNAMPLGGGLPDSGFAVITWVCDGGVHDDPSNSTLSMLRVNGHPCDRWQSAAFSTLMPTQLGYMLRATPGSSTFVGDVCQILVLHDWSTTADVANPLLANDTGGSTNKAMSYPDLAWQSGQDSELERIEGWLAHKWGIAHELPGGRVGWLTMTANPGDGETVTIDGLAYTFKNAMTPTIARHVQRSASSVRDSIINLYLAINRTGEPDVNYSRATVAHPTYRATAPVVINNTPHYAMMVRNRNPNYSPAGVFSETLLAAGSQWNSANSAPSLAGSGANTGWYPHPFYLERTGFFSGVTNLGSTVGGPPRSAGAATTSKYWLLRSPYPILAAWDPASGKAKDVLTSNFDDSAPTGLVAGSGIGGIGYGVRVASTGAVFSMGPTQGAVAAGTSWSSLGFSADPESAVIRMIPWSEQAFDPFDATYWAASLSAQVNHYPRIAVDKYDNVYFPTSASTTNTVIGIKLVATAGNDPDTMFSYIIPTTNNKSYAVAVDPTYPDFTGYASLKRAEYIVLGTTALGTDKDSVWRLRTLRTDQVSGTPRTVTNIAICGSQISKFTRTTVTAASPGPWVDTDRSFVDSVAFMDKIYIVDGHQVLRYNPVDTETETANTTETFLGTSSGGVPQRCSLIAAWNGSLVLARQAENPNQYFISKQGDPGNWDTNPYTLTQSQAIMGSDGSAGLPPDVINAFIPYNDDLAFIGGDHTIYRITGRPSPGGSGEIHLISDSVGIAFGRAWCKDPRGILYFFGSRGGVYRMAPGGLPEPLPGALAGRNRIERRLQSIDLSTYTVQMAWNDRDKGFHLIVCPFGSSNDTITEHYFWEEAHGAWWPDKWATAAIQPTCVAILDGDDPDDRTIVFGCNDSYVRALDKDSNVDQGIYVDGTNDPTYPINASVLIGPIAPKETGTEVMFSRLQAVMANDQDANPFINVYVTDRADYLGSPVWSGQLRPGRNPFVNMKRRGAFVFIEIVSSDPTARWAYEQISLDYAVPAGIKRSLGV